MSKRRIFSHGGVATPVDLDATHNPSDTVVIGNGVDTEICSIPQSGDAFEPCGNPVKLIFTGEFRESGGAARLVTFKLLRNGVEISSTDRYVQHIPANTREIITIHWMDVPAPSIPSPDYSVTASADGAAVAVVNRRLTASGA